MGEYKPTVLLSYRREDSPGTTGRIFDRLAHHYGRERVFMDIDAIPVGVDFRAHIRTYIEKSDVVLVIVGPKWNAIGDNGKRRLSNPKDWVRVEIETAIEAGVSLVPVHVDEASVPIPRHLPRSLRELPYLQAATVHPGRDFETHVQRLIREVNRLVQAGGRRRRGGRGIGGPTTPLPGPFKVSKDAPQPTLTEILQSIRRVIADSETNPSSLLSPSGSEIGSAAKNQHVLDLVNELSPLATEPSGGASSQKVDIQPVPGAPKANTGYGTLNASGAGAASTPLEKAAALLEQGIAAVKAQMSAVDRQPDPLAHDLIVAPPAQATETGGNSGLREPIHQVAIPGGSLTVFDDSTIELTEATGVRLFRNFTEFERYWRSERRNTPPDQDPERPRPNPSGSRARATHVRD
jgi:hypothetical protein